MKTGRIMNEATKNPRISVIMGIYNCADTLPEAIESILKQTVFDWELIMCDDGSSDCTYSIAKQYQRDFPTKIVLMKNEANCGLSYTLNRCLDAATGEMIARMDGDDFCVPERFEIQLKLLDSNPDIAFVSSDMGCFDDSGVWGSVSHPAHPKPIDFVHGTPFCHAPCMVRGSVFKAVGGYTDAKRTMRVEDYHLWLKMYKAGCKGENIQKQLYFMRDNRTAFRRRKFKYRLNESYIRALAVKEFGLPAINYIYSLRPILVGLLPERIYLFMHKKRLRKSEMI